MARLASFHPASDALAGAFSSLDGADEALVGQGAGVRISWVVIDGELIEVGALPDDPERVWAEVDLPTMLARDEAFRFER